MTSSTGFDYSHGAPPSYTDLFPEQANFIAERPSNGSKRTEHCHHTAAAQMQRSQSDEEVLDQALEFTRRDLGQNAQGGMLVRPIAIPQVGSGFGMPFARGYSNALSDHGISMDEFLEFIDNYTIVSGGSPPFQILDREYSYPVA